MSTTQETKEPTTTAATLEDGGGGGGLVINTAPSLASRLMAARIAAEKKIHPF